MRAHLPFLSEAYDLESAFHRVGGGTADAGSRVAPARPGHHQQGSPRRSGQSVALADPLGRLHRPALQPADADHAGQRRRSSPPQWTFQTGVVNKFEATPIVIDGVLYVTGPLNHAWAIDARTGTPDLALPASAAAGTEGVLRDGEPRVCRLRRSPVHGDARRAFRRARDEDRQGDLRHRDGGGQGRVCRDRRAARRQRQGDRRRRRRRVRESRISRRVQPRDRRAPVALLHDSRARRTGQRFVEGRDLGSAAAARRG